MDWLLAEDEFDNDRNIDSRLYLTPKIEVIHTNVQYISYYVVEILFRRNQP